MIDLYAPSAWHWLVAETGRYWSSADEAYSDEAPEVFTRIASEAELREVLEKAGCPERAPNWCPASVTLAQARVALHRAGIFAAVNSAINQAGGEALEAWEYSNTVSRNSALVLAMAAALNLTDAQVDGLFRTAHAITL